MVTTDLQMPQHLDKVCLFILFYLFKVIPSHERISGIIVILNNWNILLLVCTLDQQKFNWKFSCISATFINLPPQDLMDQAINLISLSLSLLCLFAYSCMCVCWNVVLHVIMGHKTYMKFREQPWMLVLHSHIIFQLTYSLLEKFHVFNTYFAIRNLGSKLVLLHSALYVCKESKLNSSYRAHVLSSEWSFEAQINFKCTSVCTVHHFMD